MGVGAIDKKFEWSGAVSEKKDLSLKRLFVPPKGQKVVPTSAGIILIVIGLSLGLAAYNTENNILFAAFSALLSSIIISGVICWANFRSIRWRLETGKTYRVGEEGIIKVHVENASSRFPVTCFRFEMNLAEQNLVHSLFLDGRLESGKAEELCWRFKPVQRSVTTVDLVDVVSSFPFGFLSKHIAGQCSKDITVWPEKISYTKHSTGLGGVFWQGSSSKDKGQTGELLALRKYERGDAPKSINWKASAKQQKLMVKQNAMEKQSLFSIHIDPSKYLWQNNAVFEKMCSFAASFAEDLFRVGKLDRCSVEGVATVKIKRVVDLECFFDVVAMLVVDQKNELLGDRAVPNSITFSPVEAGGVGAFINGNKIAQT